ncbi:aminotransferase class I/II-fold pyridoxal phosphate-dependent enzyme, partial [Myxococcota bacterium]|nr:aminotransferase class I/II-fold pyridoxal phosphate-dependent enzyme [Myxococcota bacterium]
MELAQGMYRIMGEGAFEYLAKAQAEEARGKKVLHFEIGQPDFPTPDHIKRAAYDAIENNFTSYVSPSGILELKETIALEVERSRGFRPDLNQILILPGAKPGIYFPMVALLEPGDEVIYPDPGFPTYGSLVSYLKAGNVPVALREAYEFRLNPEDVAAKITDRTKLIILNSPQNPTGSVMTEDEILHIARIAAEKGITILSDEIYSKMLYDAPFSSPCVLDQCRENTILLDGFSKSYSMTGWRLG